MIKVNYATTFALRNKNKFRGCLKENFHCKCTKYHCKSLDARPILTPGRAGFFILPHLGNVRFDRRPMHLKSCIWQTKRICPLWAQLLLYTFIQSFPLDPSISSLYFSAAPAIDKMFESNDFKDCHDNHYLSSTFYLLQLVCSTT